MNFWFAKNEIYRRRKPTSLSVRTTTEFGHEVCCKFSVFYPL